MIQPAMTETTTTKTWSVKTYNKHSMTKSINITIDQHLNIWFQEPYSLTLWIVNLAQITVDSLFLIFVIYQLHN